jgi:signal peptidase I
VTLDLSAVLVLALGAAGMILAAEAAYFRPRRVARGGDAVIDEGKITAYARSFFPVILIVLIVRSFLFEPFRIPSPSMMPNLVDGDFIFVSKFAYGLRLPVINTRVLSTGEPHRGDIVVFRLPADPSTHYIKRLIGLPGDHIVVRNNRLIINGSPIPLAPDGIYSGDYGFSGSALGVERLGEAEHLVMFASNRSSTDYDTTVPAGHYFFMGDNRNDSQDSRFPQVGFVPEANLVGRATRIWMNWQLPGWPHLNRIGRSIR